MSLPPPTSRASRRDWTVAVLTVLVTGVVSTWPLATSPWLVPQHQDPLFSSWRLYQWARNLADTGAGGLFSGNIFHPTPDVLLYSDAIMLPALVAAPFVLAGVPVTLVYSALFWLSVLTAGLAMYACARRVSASHWGGLVAAVIFTGAPLRLDHVMHLELLWSAGLPLTVLATVRAFEGGGRAMWALGAAMAGQFLCCIYYGVFLFTVWPLLAGVEWLRRRGRLPSGMVTRTAAALVLAAVVAGAYALPYQRARQVVGDRGDDEVARYSATWSDYAISPPSSRLWGWTASPGDAERRLFPGLVGSALAVSAIAAPVAPWTAAVVVTGVVALDASRGVHGLVYPLLRTFVPPYRGLRVPARYGMVVLTMVALLAAIGVGPMARAAGASRAASIVAAVALVAMMAEYVSAVPVRRLPRRAPPVYALLATLPPTVIAHLPMPLPERLPGPEADFQYFAQYHRHELVNGNSGFYPPSYLLLIGRVRDFPDDRALTALRDMDVEYVLVHAQHYPTREAFARVIEGLEQRTDIEPVATSTDDGGLVRIYRLRRD